MRHLVATILVIFASIFNCQGVVVNCKFQMMNWGSPLGNIYFCDSRSDNMGNLTVIEEINGEHLSGKNNQNVQGFLENGWELQYIPSNLAEFFPNLKALLIYGPLLRLVASDLKPFPNLVMFTSQGSELTSIDGDFFQHTRKLQIIEVSYGKLQNVGENILSRLNELTRADFRSNSCIQFYAESSQRIAELKKKLLTECPPLPSLTTTPIPTTEATTTPIPTTIPTTISITTSKPTTTTIPTTTVAQCSLRCSLNEEVDELRKNNSRQDGEIVELLKINAVMQSVIDKQDEIIRNQEDRLVEVEKLIREIAARP